MGALHKSPDWAGELYELVHVPTGTVVADRIRRARGLFAQGVGLIGRSGLGPGEGLWLPRTPAIHTLGLRFPLDLLFLDAELRTVGCARRVPANRPYCGRLGARSVIELAAGALDAVREITPGDAWLVNRLPPAAR